mmetsp:Transcript_38066/g.83603  ORF Transcript_38066/g.83603 Transcript_38066/m.83603 type:complete len:216 (+) Transcript_38066:1563-2210(+)
MPGRPHQRSPSVCVADVYPSPRPQLLLDSIPVSDLGCSQHAHVGAQDVSEHITDGQVLGAELLVVCLEKELWVCAMAHDELHHVQRLMQSSPHERSPAFLVREVDVGSCLDGFHHRGLVVSPGCNVETGVHLLDLQDERTHVIVLLRMVHDREPSRILEPKVEATGQKSLYYDQVTMARGPHAGTAALGVDLVVVCAGLEEDCCRLLLTVHRSPD